MTYSDIILQVSKELDLNPQLVDRIYKAYWLSVRQTIQSIPLKEDLSQQDFEKLKTNFNIPSLGKLHCTYDRMIKVKERFKYIKKFKERSSEETNHKLTQEK